MRPLVAVWLLWLAMASIMAVPEAAAGVLLQAQTPRVSLEGQLEYVRDPSRVLSFEAMRERSFERLPDFRSLGYDDDAHWFRVEARRAPDAPLRWIIAIGTPELEDVDVWVEQLDGGFEPYAMGYYRPYENRPLQTRLFAVPFDVAESAHIYFRVRTNNAINVQAEIWQPAAFSAHQTRDNFYRGLYFGILLISVILYALLGARLRDVPMAAYAGYVASLILFHLGTNGYLPVLLSSHGAWLTDALPRIGWLGGAASIVLMWDSLLGLKRHYPRIHGLYWFTLWLNLGLLPFALMPSLVMPWLLVVVKLANVLNSLNFLIGMVLVLIFWRRSRRVELLLYFIAFIIPALGTLVNTAGNQGVLAQNVVTTNLYQIASLVHVLVMSYGMALRLRQLQRDKASAEQEAAIATRRTEEQRRFVAMLSHEFRNPLAAIDRSAQMIQLKAPDLMPSEAQRLARIRANAATLSSLVDNFLLVEMLEHHGVAASRKPCGIRPLLESVIRQQSEMDAQRVRLRICPDNLSFDVDETLIGAAVGNLVANALRYSPPGSRVGVLALCDGSGLRIRVVDEGPGLDQAALAKLGTPYFRAGTSLGKKGSGLGYHFTQRIVQAHGGSLRASVRHGRGLTVEMVLPCVQRPANPA
ncbi:sensor histidine kinase [Pusillimonas sp.]|uniref:sensor histidine kinase n=1 Tax=Pusillimonas sp. TaxID=3040095 RepID=UPI0029BD1081|nr:sensor histidine kinase [Pusillimonas sp.]MDX3894733.1 sensor histidine kinase [Pusillimonas sp.]